MTEQQRNYVIVGGFGVGAVVLLALLTRKGSAPTATQPAAPAPTNAVGLPIPTYPAATFPAPAPITITESPTFNAPGNRPPFYPKTLADVPQGSACGCCDDSTQAIPVNAQTIAQLAAQYRGFAVSNRGGGRFSTVPVPSNITSQFPPNLYPQLYQSKN